MKSRYPMVVALVALVVGMLFAAEFGVSVWISATLFVVSFLAALFAKSQAVTLFTISTMGVMLCSIEQSYFVAMPTSPNRVVACCIEIERGRWSTLREWYDLDGEWHKSGVRLFTTVDSDVELKRGDIVVVNGDFKLLSKPSSHFERSIWRQGARGYIGVYNDNIVELSNSRKTLNGVMYRAAKQRLERLSLSPKAHELSMATTLGYRAEMSLEISNAYISSGVQHLLAISGLHVGIIMLMASLLFTPLVLFTHGQVWRSLVVILALWVFVLSTTMPISVVRAAVMFTLLYVSRGWSSRYNRLNGLAAIAILIIVFDVRTLYDIGFQLSFVAVAAILALTPLISGVLRGRVPHFVAKFIEALAIGVVATIAITPIVSSAFGYISPLSPFVTLPMLPLLYIMVSTSVLWMLIPLPALQPVAQWLVEWSANAQIYITSQASQWRLSQVSYRMSGWEVLLFYLLLIVIILYINRISEKK